MADQEDGRPRRTVVGSDIARSHAAMQAALGLAQIAAEELAAPATGTAQLQPAPYGEPDIAFAMCEFAHDDECWFGEARGRWAHRPQGVRQKVACCAC